MSAIGQDTDFINTMAQAMREASELTLEDCLDLARVALDSLIDSDTGIARVASRDPYETPDFGDGLVAKLRLLDWHEQRKDRDGNAEQPWWYLRADIEKALGTGLDTSVMFADEDRRNGRA